MRHPWTRARAHLAALSWKRKLPAVRAYRHPKPQAALPRHRYVPFVPGVVPGVGQGLSPNGFRAPQAPILVAQEDRPPPQCWTHVPKSGCSLPPSDVEAARLDSARPRLRCPTFISAFPRWSALAAPPNYGQEHLNPQFGN
ncbi:hypothetical protein TcCL_NonESM11475 [Trypanosoma cruzi]|nr:hypothetical protein TcCL_NonESM11475 [Trypanosoma cruzi]